MKKFKEGDIHEVTVQEVDEEYKKIILMVDLGINDIEAADISYGDSAKLEETKSEKIEIPKEIIDNISEDGEKSEDKSD